MSQKIASYRSELVDTDFGPETRVTFYQAGTDVEVGREQEPATEDWIINWWERRNPEWRVRRLYEHATNAPTPRMRDLRAGTERITKRDLWELLEVYTEGQEEDSWMEPTLTEFGAWLAGRAVKEMGTDAWATCEPADVIW